MKIESLTKIVLILSALLFSYLLVVLGYSFSPEVGLYGEGQQILREARITSNILYVISGVLLMSTLVNSLISVKDYGARTTLALSVGLGVAIVLTIVCISWFMFAH